VRAIAVQRQPRDAGREPLPQRVAQPPLARRGRVEVAPEGLVGDAEPDDGGDVLGPRAQAALVPGAEEQRPERRPVSNATKT